MALYVWVVGIFFCDGVSGQGCPQLLGNRIPLGDKKLRLITETIKL